MLFIMEEARKKNILDFLQEIVEVVSQIVSQFHFVLI